MKTKTSIIKGLFAAGILAVAASAGAASPDYPFSTWTEQFSRWKERPLEGAYDHMVSGGPAGATLVSFPYDSDPIRSLDGGVSWEAFNLNGQRAAPFYLAIAPRDAGIWYATGAVDGKFYQTIDAGRTWTAKSGPLPARHFTTDLSVSADASVVYRTLVEISDCTFEPCAPVGGTLQVSKDAGATWRDIGLQSDSMRAFASPVDPNLVFAAGLNGLQRSRDQGTTWQPVQLPPGVPPTSSGVSHMALDRFDPAVAYLTPSAYELGSRILSTRDGGVTWTPATLAGGRLIADGTQGGRAYLFTYFFGAYETRDAGRTWVKVEPTNYTSANSNVAGVVLREGRRVAVGPYFHKLKELDLSGGALALASDLWWNPDESGWGVTITHRASNQTFVAWYGYDKDGAPVWRVMPGGQWNDRTFSGDLYETTAAPYFGASFDPSKVVVRKVGTARIVFDNENSAVFSYQLAIGESSNKRISRQLFGPTVPEPAIDESYADLWWNAAESGWGIAINHQNDNIFATWFAYDDQGKPLWVVMPDAKVVLVNGVPTASGDIYTTRGPSSSGPFDPSQVVATKVGTATLTFRPEGDAVLSSTAFGRTETRTITRQPF